MAMRKHGELWWDAVLALFILAAAALACYLGVHDDLARDVIEERAVQAKRTPFVENPPKGEEAKPSEPQRKAVKGKGTTTITGTVTYDGDIGELDKTVNKLNTALLKNIWAATAEKDMCLAGSKEDKSQFQWIVNKENKGVKNVFVWIRPLTDDEYFDVSDLVKKGEGFSKLVKLDQPHCAFLPHAFLLFQRYVDPSDPDRGDHKQPKTGQKFEVVNSAVRAHNTKWEGKAAINGGNVSIAPKGIKPIDDFKASYDGPVLFACSVHPWMRSYAWSLPHPFAAVTDENGKYEIKGVPGGVKVRIVAWHEEARFLEGDGKGAEFEILKDVGARKDFKVKK
jgi:hypothetical protein